MDHSGADYSDRTTLSLAEGITLRGMSLFSCRRNLEDLLEVDVAKRHPVSCHNHNFLILPSWASGLPSPGFGPLTERCGRRWDSSSGVQSMSRTCTQVSLLECE